MHRFLDVEVRLVRAGPIDRSMFFDKFDVTAIQTKAHGHLDAVGHAVARLIAARVRASAYVRGAGVGSPLSGPKLSAAGKR